MLKATLLQNFGYTHWVLSQNVEGMTHAESLTPAATGANCLNWVVGHMLRSRNGVHALLGLEPAFDEVTAALYKQGNAPLVGDESGIVPFDQLVVAFDRSQQALMSRLQKVTDAELAAPCKHILNPEEDSTVGVQLGGLNFHESYHTGQTGILRRLAGKSSSLPSPA